MTVFCPTSWITIKTIAIAAVRLMTDPRSVSAMLRLKSRLMSSLLIDASGIVGTTERPPWADFCWRRRGRLSQRRQRHKTVGFEKLLKIATQAVATLSCLAHQQEGERP